MTLVFPWNGAVVVFHNKTFFVRPSLKNKKNLFLMLNLVASLVFTTSHINDLSTKKDSEREYNYMLLCPPLRHRDRTAAKLLVRQTTVFWPSVFYTATYTTKKTKGQTDRDIDMDR